jgi:hypothetical protein
MYDCTGKVSADPMVENFRSFHSEGERLSKSFVIATVLHAIIAWRSSGLRLKTLSAKKHEIRSEASDKSTVASFPKDATLAVFWLSRWFRIRIDRENISPSKADRYQAAIACCIH